MATAIDARRRRWRGRQTRRGGARPGGARHQGPRGWAARTDGARRPVTERARPTAQGRTAAILPGARRRRALGRDRRFVRRPRRAGSCDACRRCADSADPSGAVAGGRRARGWSSAAAGPVARPRPGPDRAADRRDARCSAGRSSRCRRSRIAGRRRGWWLWAVRRVIAAHPANPVPRRRTVAFLAGHAGARVRPAVGHRPLRHDPVLGPHGPARPADARRGAAARPGRADHAAPAAAAPPQTRRRWILPVLHSRVVRFLAFPVVAWVMFAA